VNDILAVEVLDGLEGLGEELEGLHFRKDAFGVLVREEVALLGIFHDHVDRIGFQESVPEFDYVRVVQLAVQPDLSLDQLGLHFRGHVSQINLARPPSTILSAYMRQVLRWRASLTVPKDPQPTLRPSMITNSVMRLNRC
jgi:hypothetical protein